MNEGGDDVETRVHERRRAEAWAGSSPVLWLFVVEIFLGLLVLPLSFYLRLRNLTFTFLFLVLALYLFYFWIAFYAFVEFQLWRRMGNLGHLYQFLGGLLIVVPVLWAYVPVLLGLPTVSFGILSTIVQSLTSAAGITGLVMALYGYYHEPFHARDVDLYRNVVVRAGERLDVLTDGYSTRVFEARYEGLPSESLRTTAEAYAVRFQEGGFYLAHHADDHGITLYPVAYTGVGAFRWGTALRHLYRLARQPESLTWVQIEWSGTVHVHISPEDYARIRRPVAHHLLCNAVADAVVGSLLAYARHDEPGAAANLLGVDRVRSPRQLDLPGRVERRDARILAVFAVVLLVAGIAGTSFSVFAAENPYAVTDVHWSPTQPLPGQAIQVYATLESLQSLSPPDAFQLIWWAYFGPASATWPPTSGEVPFQPYQGNEYTASLGPFANGTEVTFVAAVNHWGTATVRFFQSPPQVIDIGTVTRGGPSGLSLSAPGLIHPSTDSGTTLGVWINSSAAITVAQAFLAGNLAWTFPNGAGSFAVGAPIFNLTASGGYYSVYFDPSTLIPAGYTHLSGTLDFEFVAQDATGNTATSPFMVIQFDQSA